MNKKFQIETSIPGIEMAGFKNHENADRKCVKYSIHTMTVRAPLSPYDWKNIKDTLIDYSMENKKGYYKEENTDGKNKYIKFKIAERFRFNMVMLMNINTETGNRRYMDIKINPRKMFHPYDHPFSYIAKPEELEESYLKIQEFLDDAGITEIDDGMFYLHRVDYCVNIDLGSSVMVQEYMRLMKKGAYPYGSKRLQEYSESRKRYIPTKNSFSVQSKSFEFSIYDKQSQLSDEGEKYSEDEIEEAKGLVRIELRIARSKIRSEEKKYECAEALDFLRETDKIAKDNIPRYLSMIYGTGKFVCYKAAKQIIMESSCHKNTKKDMIEILKMTSKNNLQFAKSQFNEHFHYYMNIFNKLGISPITLASDSKVLAMQNPIFYIEHNNRNYD